MLSPTTRLRRTAATLVSLAVGGGLLVATSSPATAALPGTGSAADPHLIATEADFRAFVAQVNAAPSAVAAFELTADITLTAPIPMITELRGTLDGAGHTVSGLSVVFDATASNKSAALIGDLRGSVTEIGFADVRITGNATNETQSTGTKRATVALNNRGLVDEVSVQGTVSGGWRSGGIVADNFGTVSDSYFRGTVVGSWETGGIAARNDNSVAAVVDRNYVLADVTTTNNNAGLITSYGYDNTVISRNVALGGSVSGLQNLARITGRTNTNPRFSDNLALATLPVNGRTVTGTATSKEGADRTAEQLAQQATWEAIGWDFTTTWTFDPEAKRPVLTDVPEPAAPEEPQEPGASEKVEVTSPDGGLVTEVFVTEAGDLGYRVLQDGVEAVRPSDLGLVVDGVDLGADAALGTPERYSADATYPLLGTKETGTDHHEGASIPVLVDGEEQLTLDLRVFDSGIAFAYRLDDSLEGATVQDENTTVRFDPAGTMHYQPYAADTIDDLQNVWNTSVLSAIGDRDITVLPTVELPANAGFVNISEANIRDWPALALHVDGSGTVGLWNWATDNRAGTFPVPATLRSPWRVLTIAEDLDELSSSDILTAVSDPADPALFADSSSWLKPGTSVWMPQNGAGFRSVPADFRAFIESSGKAGIPYVLIEDVSDSSWGTTTTQKLATIRSLADLGAAQPQPVKLWFWSDYDNGNGADQAFVNGVQHADPNADRNSLVDPDFRKAYLDALQAAGVVGIKIDHLNEETETKVNFYGDFNQATAERKMMVIYHNPLAPSGLNRTYPHELTREAIRGVQYRYEARLNTIMPFTRLVAGSADYTPLTFSNASKLGDATWAHQMASTIVYTAPYLQLSEVPTSLVPGGRHEAHLTDFVRNLPTTWKSSRVLPQSRIGRLAAVVRETTDGEWYVAAQAAPGATQQLSLDLSFLPAGTTYNADVYTDGASAASVKRETRVVTDATTLTADLASGGGWVVRITTAEIDNPTIDPEQFEIATEADLDLIRQHPWSTFDLTADIELTKPFEPIPFFAGTLDGNGHVIDGLDVAGAASKAMIIDNSGTIERLGLTDARAVRTGDWVQEHRVAILTVTNRGLIDQVYVAGAEVNGGWRSGGIAAENHTTISNSYVVDAQVTANWESGGVVAWNSNTAVLEDSYADVDARAMVNNVGVVSAYGYAGTRIEGNVALGGSVRGVDNVGRVNGRENGMPTYARNLGLQSIPVNGLTVIGGDTTKHGRSATPAELAAPAAYRALGWDFDTVWSFSDALGRPVLSANAEDAPAPVIAVARTSVTLPAGATPSVPDVLAAFGATVDRGELGVDLSGVDFGTPGTYPVSLTATAEGVDAEPVSGQIVVEAVDAPVVSSRTTLSSTRPTQRYGAANPVRVTARVTAGPAPRGTVTFRDGGRVLARVPVANGVAAYVLPRRLSVGARRVTAVFASTDASVVGSQATTSVRVTKAVATVRASLARPTVKRGQRAQLQLRVRATGSVPVTGRVWIYRGAKRIANVRLAAARNGVLKVRLPKLAAGQHRLRAEFRGSATVLKAGSKRVVLRVR